VAARVDQRRIPLGERLGIESEALERAGPEVGEEHVGAGDQLLEDLAATFGAQVERH
jgi:hypothetical protein